MSVTEETSREIAPIINELKINVTGFVVTDQISYDAANAFLEKCDAALRRINEIHDPAIKAAHEAHKKALEAKKSNAGQIEQLRAEVSRKMAAWWKAEQQRLADERRAAEEEARRKAEEVRLKEAEALEQAGMNEAASASLEAPLPVADFIKPVTGPQKASGISYRDNWKAEVVDLMTLVKAVASGKAPLSYLEANMTALNQAAKALRGTQDIPGVRQYSETVQAKRYA
jgi:hypothetical protein